MSDRPSRSIHFLIFGWVAVSLLFFVIYLIGIVVVSSFTPSESADPTETTNGWFGLVFVLGFLFVSGLILFAFRKGYGWIIRGVMLFTVFLVSWMVFATLVPQSRAIAGIEIIPIGCALLLTAVVTIHPKWYVINTTGVVVGAGIVGLLGFMLDIRTIFILLLVLAVYDMIAVYGTKHMQTLASEAMDARLPVVLILPLPGKKPTNDEDMTHWGDQQGVFVIGLGDAVIPGLLVTGSVIGGFGRTVGVGGFEVTSVAVGGIIGIIFGLSLLFGVAARGGSHPGLPLLNGGAILGVVIVALWEGISLGQLIG